MTEPCPTCGAAAPDLSALTAREAELVALLRTGLRLSQIATELGISWHTVRNHLKMTNRKLGVHSQIELLAVLSGQLPQKPLRPRNRK